MNHTIISTAFIILHTLTMALCIAYAFFKGWLKLDHRNLFHQKLFWLAIILPFTSFFAYGIWAWWGHAPDLSASGYEEFYNISKVPLLFLAASVPLAAIVNNIHRTIQTETQIKESEKKNLSDSYYTHFKNTLDLFKHIQSKELSLTEKGEKFTLSINNPVSLYNSIYKNSSYKTGVNHQACNIFKDSIKKDWHKINIALDRLWPLMCKSVEDTTAKDKIKILLNLYRLESAFERICHTLTLGTLTQSPRPVFRSSRGYYVGLFHNASALTSGIKELDKICLKIFDIVITAENNVENIHHSYFLNKNVYLNYSSILHLRNGDHLLTKSVALHIKNEKEPAK